MKGTGILIDDDHDLQIVVKRDTSGLITRGVVIGNVTSQNQELIILTNKGEIKDNPTKGVGVVEFLDDEVPDNLLRAVRTELALDGMEVLKVKFNSNSELEIDANYK